MPTHGPGAAGPSGVVACEKEDTMPRPEPPAAVLGEALFILCRPQSDLRALSPNGEGPIPRNSSPLHPSHLQRVVATSIAYHVGGTVLSALYMITNQLLQQPY